MSKKSKKRHRRTHTQNHDQKQQQWMLRFKISACFVLFWLIVVVLASRYLPDPTSSSAFFQESHALWFIHIGFLLVLVKILIRA